MDSVSYQKKEASPFVRREQCLEQIELPTIAEVPMTIADDIPKGYEDPRWIEKSNSIKKRDNFTCQLCHTFNPMRGELVYIQHGEYETYHQYEIVSNCYMIHVKGYGCKINFNFYPDFHLVMPRLNVHHKLYYRNRNLWDYQDDCLVTLCEECHHYVHSLNNICIPIIEENSNGQPIHIDKMPLKSYCPELDHTDLGTFRPFTIVKENRWGTGLKGQDAVSYKRAKNENKKWYDYHDTLDKYVVHIDFFKCYDPRWNKYTPEEIRNVASFIIQDFVENILGYIAK